MNQQNPSQQNDKPIPARINLSLNNIEILKKDLNNINEGLDIANKKGVYSLKDSHLLCGSLENIASIIYQISQSVVTSLEQMQKLQKNISEQNNNQNSNIEEINDEESSEDRSAKKVKFSK